MEMIRANNLAEVFDALAGHPEALLLAGGTDTMVLVNAGVTAPDYVISLRRVEELKRWDDAFIGAGVTFARLEKSRISALAELARTVGSPQIRAAGTIGGNLRNLPWNEFLVGPKKNALQPGEVILGVHLPADVSTHTAFAKIGVRQAMVISIASVCVSRSEDGCTKVALGSVGPTVLRAHRAEEMISGELDPDSQALDRFQQLVSEESRPITDHRSTEEYRRKAVGILARRALERCLV